jgi:hypothetical protein
VAIEYVSWALGYQFQKGRYCSVDVSRKLRIRASRSGLVKSFNPGLP